MTTWTSVVTSTSTGTGVAKTRLNGDASFTTSNLAGALKEIAPVQAATGVYTAAESCLTKFSLESTSIGSIAPKRWVITPTHGGLGTFAGVQVPIIESHTVNVNLGKSNIPLDYYGQSYVANTAAFRVGATQTFTTEAGPGRQVFYETVENETGSGTAAAAVDLNSISINNGTQLSQIYSFFGVGTVTASESYLHRLSVTSSDLDPIQTISAYGQPVGAGLGTAVEVLQPGSKRYPEAIRLARAATLTATNTLDEALTSAANIVWGCAFLRN